MVKSDHCYLLIYVIAGKAGVVNTTSCWCECPALLKLEYKEQSPRIPRRAAAAAPWCRGVMGRIAASTPGSTWAQIPTTAPLRSVLRVRVRVWYLGISGMSFFSNNGPNLCYSFALQVPASTEDSDFEGPETDMYVLCHGHGKAAERRVAFEGIHTGRRFLCCAEKVWFQLN